MCTVSIVSHATGVRLVCNRDEKRTRARALKPRVQEIGVQRALFPIDPDGGGTWVGVNSSGLVAAVLNRTAAVESSSIATPGGQRMKSRGAIVPHVLGSATLDEAIDRTEALSNVPFAPFRLLLLRHRALWIVTGGGEDTLAIERAPLLTAVVVASSSLGDRRVEAPRRALFGELISKHAGSPLDAQSALHAHRWPAGPEISVVMSRRDARTVSRTQIDVIAFKPGMGPHVEMRYGEIVEPDRPPRLLRLLRGLTPGSDPFLSTSCPNSAYVFVNNPTCGVATVEEPRRMRGGLTPGSDPVVIHKDGDGAPC